LIRSTVWLVDEVDGNRGDEGDCERKFCAISSVSDVVISPVHP